jgi:hypothetical protein
MVKAKITASQVLSRLKNNSALILCWWEGKRHIYFGNKSADHPKVRHT